MRAALASAVLVLVACSPTPTRANDLSTGKANEALEVCDDVERMPSDARMEKLDRLVGGVALGEQAVQADDSDARAHFALVCNLGKQMELVGLSWRVLGRLRRMQAELSRTLQLDPDYTDALVSQGEMLRRLPRPLGGDKSRAMRLFQRAVEIQPDHLLARLYIARAMKEDGAPDARAKANEALVLAQKVGATRVENEARELLASPGD